MIILDACRNIIYARNIIFVYLIKKCKSFSHFLILKGKNINSKSNKTLFDILKFLTQEPSTALFDNDSAQNKPQCVTER